MKNTLAIVEIIIVSLSFAMAVYRTMAVGSLISTTWWALTVYCAIELLPDALKRFNATNKDDEKITVALYLSIFSGFGHIYLKRYRQSIPYCLVTCTLVPCVLLYMTRTTFYYGYEPILAISLVILSVCSYVSVQRICDKSGLPKGESSKKALINSRYLGLVAASALVAFIAVLWGLSLLFLNEILPAEGSPIPAYAVLGLSLLALIPAVWNIRGYLNTGLQSGV